MPLGTREPLPATINVCPGPQPTVLAMRSPGIRMGKS